MTRVLVTGAASGIGREMARLAATRGARVVACDVDTTGLASLAEELGSITDVRTDVVDVTDRVLAEVDERVKGRFDEVIVYSFDSQDGKGLLDFLPSSATKQTALEYVAEEYGVAREDVVFCGDSGNDIFPLTAGFSGVLVRNADDQLVANVRAAMRENPGLKVYFARGDFKGLSGFYTSGVIEGGYHYGVFSDP